MFDKIKKFLFVNTNTKQTLAKNTFWLFFGEIVSKLLKIFLVIYATRVLGASGWGAYSYAVSLIGIFTIFTDIGLSTFIISCKNRENYNEYLSTAFSLKGIILIFTLVITLIAAPIVSTIPEVKPILPILTLVAILDLAKAFILSLSKSIEKMEYEGMNKILSGLVVSILGILFLYINPTTKNLSLSYLATSIVSIFFVMHIFRSFKIKFKLHLSKIKEIWDFSWPITVIGFFATIMFNIDTYMIGIWQSVDQIGLYTAAQRLAQFFHFIPGLLGTIFLPFFIKIPKEDTEVLKNSIQKVTKMMLLLSIPITFAGVVLSKELIFQSFGSEYLGATTILSILMFSMIFVSINFILDNIIISFNIQKKFIQPILIGLVLEIILNTILIPRYGILGGTISIILSQGVILTLMYLKLRKILKFPLIPNISRIILSSTLMATLVYVLKMQEVNLPIIIISGILFYIGFLIVIKEEILAEMMSAIKNINNK